MSKITLGQSVRIKNMVANGESTASVAAQFGISEGRVKSFCPTLKAPPKKRAKKVKQEVEDVQEENQES